jgi:hypothetical protein
MAHILVIIYIFKNMHQNFLKITHVVIYLRHEDFIKIIYLGMGHMIGTNIYLMINSQLLDNFSENTRIVSSAFSDEYKKFSE